MANIKPCRLSTIYDCIRGPHYSLNSEQPELLGDLSEHIAETIDALLLTANSATDKPIYSAVNHGSGTYTRSATCWGRELDLTPISPWNSDGAHQKAGIAVSPRHVLFATHFLPAVNSTIRFVTADNTVITRTITAFQSTAPDFTIGLLSADLPPSIGFARVLPTNADSFMPYPGIPLMATDQEEKLLVAEIGSMDGSVWYGRVPTESQRLSFYEAFVGGDSGSQTCVPVDGKLVLFSLVGAGAGGGARISSYIDSLNTLMTNLGGGYQLTQVSLNAFTEYANPPAPVLSLDSKGDETITIEWTGGLAAEIYDGENVIAGPVSGPSLELVGLTNFQTYNLKAKARDGLLKSAFSNEITTFPSYGPITVPANSESDLVTKPPGAWTLFEIIWGLNPATMPFGFLITTEDATEIYTWVGTEWEDGILGGSAPDVAITQNFFVTNPTSEQLSFWNGIEP
jgi:hypothetical protein